jgi:hypothetical protein
VEAFALVQVMRGCVYFQKQKRRREKKRKEGDKEVETAGMEMAMEAEADMEDTPTGNEGRGNLVLVRTAERVCELVWHGETTKRRKP